MKNNIFIKGVGSFVPAKFLTNDDLSKMVDTSDEWISQRTGIKKRHIVEDGQTCSDIAYESAKIAIENSKIAINEIGGVIVATSTPDNAFPSTATKVQKLLGLENVFAFDMNAACSGFVYALEIAKSMLCANDNLDNILVIGAEVMSGLVDWEDRNTCVLFGDGAGAVVLSKSKTDDKYFDTCIYAKGENYDLLKTNISPNNLKNSHLGINMSGQEVFKFASSSMASSVKEILEKNNLTIENVDLLIPHQANMRIIDKVGSMLKISDDKVVKTVSDYANTSAATIPIAMHNAYNNGKLNKGNVIVLTAMGAGFTWGSVITTWGE